MSKSTAPGSYGKSRFNFRRNHQRLSHYILLVVFHSHRWDEMGSAGLLDLMAEY